MMMIQSLHTGTAVSCNASLAHKSRLRGPLIAPCWLQSAFLRQHSTCRRSCGRHHLCQASNQADSGGIQESAAADELAEYTQLKADINSSVQKFMAFLFIYLLLVTTSDVACCAGFGSLVGYGYLQLLMRDVDSFKEDDPIAAAFMSLEDASLNLRALGSPKKVFAALRAALRPRLLVLLGLGVVVGAYDAVAPEPLNTSQIAALFGGFLSYKSGLLNQVWEALRPKFDPQALTTPPRPRLAQVEEEEDLSEEEWRQRFLQRAPRPDSDTQPVRLR